MTVMFRAPLKPLCLALVAIGLMAMSREPLPSGFSPDHDDAPIWGIMRAGTRFRIDQAKGLYIASFDPTLRRSEGKSFTVSGYLLPLEATSSFHHFVVTRRSPGCPFCPPNEIGEAIEVFSRKPVAYSQAEVTFSGTLRLVPSSADGMFYRLDDAAQS
jgi:hypothetical protein